MVSVFYALKCEINPFLERLEGAGRAKLSLPAYEGLLDGRPVRIVRTGIGGRALDPRLLDGCDLLVSAGWCGALVPSLRTGDVVVATSIAPGTGGPGAHEAEGARAPGGAVRAGWAGPAGPFTPPAPVDSEALPSPELLEAIRRRTGVRVLPGPTVTSSRVVRTAEEKAGLHRATSALSVDMEDLHRMGLAKRCGVPFVSLRAVLDELGDPVPGGSGGPGPRDPGHPGARRGVASAVRACGAYASLLRKCGPASRNLAAVVSAYIESRAAPSDAGSLENPPR